MAHFKYPPSWYDQNFHLKVSPLLWFVIFWSSHHVLLLGLSIFAKSGQIFQFAMDYAYHVPSLLSDVPGILVLVAAASRSASAGARVRAIWRHGVTILATGLGLQVGTLLSLHWQRIAELDEWMVGSLLLSVALLVVVVASRHFRDIFADFPAPEEANKA